MPETCFIFSKADARNMFYVFLAKLMAETCFIFNKADATKHVLFLAKLMPE